MCFISICVSFIVTSEQGVLVNIKKSKLFPFVINNTNFRLMELRFILSDGKALKNYELYRKLCKLRYSNTLYTTLLSHM